MCRQVEHPPSDNGELKWIGESPEGKQRERDLETEVLLFKKTKGRATRLVVGTRCQPSGKGAEPVGVSAKS